MLIKYILKKNNYRLNLKKGMIIYIESSYFKTLNIKGEVVEVFKNPTISEINKEIKSWTNIYGGTKAGSGGIRALLTLDGKDLYVWDANIAMHIDIIKDVFNKSPKDFIPLEIYNDGQLYITPTAYARDVTPQQRGTYKNIISNSKIISQFSKLIKSKQQSI
jgi:hypothetical protein